MQIAGMRCDHCHISYSLWPQIQVMKILKFHKHKHFDIFVVVGEKKTSLLFFLFAKQIRIWVMSFMFFYILLQFICELNVFPFSFAVPPSKPTIFDETGREVKDLVGPYLEGETIVLKCITSGGKSPSLFQTPCKI